MRHIDVTPEMRKGPGRPQGYSQKRVEKILGLLPEDGSYLPAKTLKEKAEERGFGFDTLYRYLEILEQHGFVAKRKGSKISERICYRRVTAADFFNSEKLLQISKLEAQLHELLRHTAEGKLSTSLRVKVLRSWLGYIFPFIPLIAMKAGQIGDSKRRTEFIDLTLKIYLAPKVSILSAVKVFEPKDWIRAVKPYETVFSKSSESALNEVIASLPAPLRPLARKFVNSMSSGDESKVYKNIARLIKKTKGTVT